MINILIIIYSVKKVNKKPQNLRVFIRTGRCFLEIGQTFSESFHLAIQTLCVVELGAHPLIYTRLSWNLIHRSGLHGVRQRLSYSLQRFSLLQSWHRIPTMPELHNMNPLVPGAMLIGYHVHRLLNYQQHQRRSCQRCLISRFRNLRKDRKAWSVPVNVKTKWKV